SPRMSLPWLTPTSSTWAAPTGVPEAGDPIQYDELRIEHDHGAVEIVVYNRASLLFTTDSEAAKRIHRVCCRLEDIAGRHRRGSGVASRPVEACGPAVP